MAGTSKLTGSPWHTEKMTRKEGDPRRHRSKCVHYEKVDGYCHKRFMKCVGSAHCDHYSALPESVTAAAPPQKKPPRVQPFDGVKTILMEDIQIGEIPFKQPSKAKAQKIIDYYNQHGTLDKPIVVTCEGNKYLLQDKYLRYYVAKVLGLKELPARMGTYGDKAADDRIHNVGQKIQHKTFGKGTVVKSTLDTVEIEFESGKIIKFDIRMCIDGKIITLL